MADCEICHDREMRFFDPDFEVALCAQCRNELTQTLEAPGGLKALFTRRWAGAAKPGWCDICNERPIRAHSRALAVATCLTCSERVRRRAAHGVAFESVTTTSETHASGHQQREQSDRRSPPPPDDTDNASARSPYEVLGIATTATSQEIKGAYRRLARMYHPDRVADLGPEFGVLAERRMKGHRKHYRQFASRGPMQRASRTP